MFRRLRNSLQRFLYGRYGNDRLNILLFVVALALMLLGTLLGRFPSEGLLWTAVSMRVISELLLVLMIFRFLSRNFRARQRENQWLLRNWRNLTDRKSRYFCCPKCSQTVRVPRGRGKICIRCPKCNEKFVKKS